MVREDYNNRDLARDYFAKMARVSPMLDAHMAVRDSIRDSPRNLPGHYRTHGDFRGVKVPGLDVDDLAGLVPILAEVLPVITKVERVRGRGRDIASTRYSGISKGERTRGPRSAG